MHLRALLMLAGAAGFLAACGSSTSTANSCGNSGANANVNTTSSNQFSPAGITINHGERVCWQGANAVTHTVTDSGGAFDVNLPPSQIFIHTYPTAGTFPYYCKIHTPGMIGTVTVK